MHHNQSNLYKIIGLGAYCVTETKHRCMCALTHETKTSYSYGKLIHHAWQLFLFHSISVLTATCNFQWKRRRYIRRDHYTKDMNMYQYLRMFK